MKISTICNQKQARPALILTNRVNQCEYCLDLTEFNTYLQATTSSVGLEPTPSSVLKMIEGGAPVLANLKKIEERLRLHLNPDGNWDLYNGIPNARRHTSLMLRYSTQPW